MARDEWQLPRRSVVAGDSCARFCAILPSSWKADHLSDALGAQSAEPERRGRQPEPTALTVLRSDRTRLVGLTSSLAAGFWATVERNATRPGDIWAREERRCS